MGNSREVVLKIALKSAAIADLASRIKAHGITTTETADLSRTVSATLQSTAFEIAPSGTLIQKLYPDRETTWSWVIKPISAGSQTLLLTIASEMPSDRRMEPITREITVKAIEASTGDDVQKFILSNWKELLSMMIIPIGTWAWGLFAGTAKQSREENATSTGGPTHPSTPS